ncbi:hypothetical protein AC02_4907 [Escherichia coli 3-020-07_S3_C1]|nr:hypothetical protein [Escherichia coli]KDY56526.1 hypothetical protein AD02_5614 [Escherichia coli 2-460-02_S4_C2]KDY60774.1 hypothetical protein AD02_5167 [Escherichia coli 2-460-02_S4_C2]KDY63046.1 hypothetical protein AD02_4815 [Escherichia coli 2-460-02_S4_C2]KDY70585.1 hypothetical protein AD32_5491 [Escherichia coli 2-460-02_S4_C3]KDY72507.1 hypothetical protein AD32_4931 [Escherichia coli 2-460-02_S4_C3]
MLPQHSDIEIAWYASISAQKLEELLASMVKDEVDRNDGIY